MKHMIRLIDKTIDQHMEQSVLGPCCLLLYLIWQLFVADDFSRRHFQMHFFLGALRVKTIGQHMRLLYLLHICTKPPLNVNADISNGAKRSKI